MGFLHDFDPAKFLIYLFVLAYSCILHECAHVWVALKLGDPTGRDLGRLTLDPRPHIDLYWTLILPALAYLSHLPVIGGPKPAPVNPSNFRNPRSGFMWTSLAGPATNFLLATFGFLLLWLLFKVAPDTVRQEVRDPETGDLSSYQVTWGAIFLTYVMFTNVTLGAFNLIPVPPLDGSRFLRWIVGRSGEGAVDRVERMGMIPLLLAVVFLAPYAIGPFRALLLYLLARVFPSGYPEALLTAYFS
jgi:Zn-dependent protease